MKCIYYPPNYYAMSLRGTKQSYAATPRNVFTTRLITTLCHCEARSNLTLLHPRYRLLHTVYPYSVHHKP